MRRSVEESEEWCEEGGEEGCEVGHCCEEGYSECRWLMGFVFSVNG